MAASRLAVIDNAGIGLFAPPLVVCWVVVRRRRPGRDCALDLLTALVSVTVAPVTIALGAIYSRNNHSWLLQAPFFLPMLILAIRTKGATDTLSKVRNSMWSKAIAPLLNEMHLYLVFGVFLVSVSGATLMFENDRSTRWIGYCWLQVWPSIFTAHYVVSAAIAVRNIVSAGHLEQEDRHLVYAIGISLPFLAVLEAWKLYLLLREGFGQFALYRVGACNVIIAILPQMLLLVACNFVGLATAPAAAHSIADENESRSTAIEARVLDAHEDFTEAGAKAVKGGRNEQ